nr:hypothetical protein [Tanacetum cinerariifolium]
MFLKYSTGQILPKKSRGKGSQGKKTADTHVADVDVFEESNSEPAKKKTASRRMVKKKVIISAADNIIPDSDVALELEEDQLAFLSEILSKKLKGVQSLTLEEQEAAYIMQALKEIKTKGSSEGTGRQPGVPDESTVISTTTKEDQSEDEQVDWIYSDEEEEKKDDDDDDRSIDLELTDDEVLHGVEQANDDEDEEMTNAEVEDSREGDAETSDVAKANVKKTKDVKDDAKKAEVPPKSSSLSVSSSFVLKPVQESHSVKLVTSFAPPSVSIIPHVPLQQTTTPILTPPTTTGAPTITIVVSESDALIAVQLRVAKLENDVSELKNIDHSVEDLATLKLYHALMEALIEDENSIDKGVVNTVKDHKRKHDDDDDDDEDPPAGPNQGKMTKRKRTKEFEPLKKPSTTKETPKGKAPSKGSRTAKSASAKEPLKEPIAKVVMDDAGKDVVRNDDQPQDTLKIKTDKTLKCIKLEYNFQECYNALTEKLDWNNLKGNRYPFDLSNPLPLVKKLHGYGHLEEIVVKRDDRQLCKFKEESYQKKLNITAPQKTFPKIKFIELYTPSYKPPGVIYKDLNKQKRVMRADELYKFSDGTLKKVQEKLHNKVLNFCLRYNNKIEMRKWTDIDKKRSKLMIELIEKQMHV